MLPRLDVILWCGQLREPFGHACIDIIAYLRGDFGSPAEV